MCQMGNISFSIKCNFHFFEYSGLLSVHSLHDELLVRCILGICFFRRDCRCNYIKGKNPFSKTSKRMIKHQVRKYESKYSNCRCQWNLPPERAGKCSHLLTPLPQQSHLCLSPSLPLRHPLVPQPLHSLHLWVDFLLPSYMRQLLSVLPAPWRSTDWAALLARPTLPSVLLKLAAKALSPSATSYLCFPCTSHAGPI